MANKPPVNPAKRKKKSGDKSTDRPTAKDQRDRPAADFEYEEIRPKG